MGAYVLYTSASLAIHKRERTPLGKVTAWFAGRLAGSSLQSSLSFLTSGSWVTRYAVAVTVGILIGGLIDLSFHWALPAFETSSLTCGVLGALVGISARGAGGFPIGCVWGWLVGGITDSIVAETIDEPIHALTAKVIAWLLTCLIAWGISQLAEWAYEKFSEKSYTTRKVFIRVTISIVLISSAAFILQAFRWSFPDLSRQIIFNPAQIYWLVVIVSGGSLASFLVAMYVDWKNEMEKKIYAERIQWLLDREVTRYSPEDTLKTRISPHGIDLTQPMYAGSTDVIVWNLQQFSKEKIANGLSVPERSSTSPNGHNAANQTSMGNRGFFGALSKPSLVVSKLPPCRGSVIFLGVLMTICIFLFIQQQFKHLRS